MGTPTIIDSLFLELGIDTSKFSSDQQKALAKITEFETKAKKSGKGASDAIKTVGEAFRDLAKESRIGASAAGVEQLAGKLTMLGKSAQAAGLFGGAAAEGLGMLLSPVSIGIAAVGALGAVMWDLNSKMSDTNATIYRQAQLSGMNAANLWDWGEAAKTVGANPQEVTGGIAALQTSIMGMGIGAANATPQLTALARLGVPFNFKTGADIPALVTKVHEMAAAGNYENLGALRALTGPVMNDALFNIATNQAYDPSKLKAQIHEQEAANTGEILRKSLESQSVLGKLGISKDILAETAYGGTQGLMQAMVELLTRILDGVTKLVDFLVGVPSAVVDSASRIPDNFSSSMSSVWKAVKDMFSPTQHKATSALKTLMGFGASATDAEAIVGNLMQESSMNPMAENKKGYRGLAQWSKSRQADFAKRFGYGMGSNSVGEYKQSLDQLQFLWEEMQGPQQQAAREMAKAKDLFGKTSAFMKYFEAPGDSSLNKRFAFAQSAKSMADTVGATSNRSHVTVSNDTRIGEVNIHTPSTDPDAHADSFIKGVSTHPLFGPTDLGKLALGTRGMSQ